MTRADQTKTREAMSSSRRRVVTTARRAGWANRSLEVEIIRHAGLPTDPPHVALSAAPNHAGFSCCPPLLGVHGPGLCG